MKKILLVNNQEAFLDRNKGLLNRAGFQIVIATSANEALQVCREQSISLIIAQLQMPEMGGDQFCRQIRQESELREVSIILVCYNSEAELKRASHCGANAVVTKPVRPEQLLGLVGKFLGIQARRDHRAALNASIAGTRGNQMFSGMTRNVSASGILCQSATLLKQDDQLRDLLFAIDASEIAADGKVVWTAGMPDGQYSYGVQFLNLAPELQEKIELFVAAPHGGN